MNEFEERETMKECRELAKKMGISGEGMIFLTEYWALNEVGRLCKMCGEIEADDWEDAEEKAAQLGHEVKGPLVAEIEAPEMANFCDDVQRLRDEDWLKGPE